MRVQEMLRRIQGEYMEMPGLRLTAGQAQRLWGIGATECEALIGALVEAGVLARTADGAFVRRDANSPGLRINARSAPRRVA